ncbi:MAG TPA: hypothetical protein VI076_15005 [Actinopolymorphaceae bacterium]
MTRSLLSFVPKVIIGNPETKGIAYDAMPNYRPRLAPRVTIHPQELRYDDRPLPLDAENDFLLRRCHPERTSPVSRIVEAYAEHFGLDLDDAMVDAYARLKWARSLGLVHRDNRFTDDGLFLRIRRLRDDGTEDRRWVFLPPFTQRVLELASGSFSCREIAATIAAERSAGTTADLPHDVLERAVLECCRRLVAEQIVAWIDDEDSRARRLEEFLAEDRRDS